MTEQKAPERAESDTCPRCGEDYGYCGCTQAEQLAAEVEALTAERDALAAELRDVRMSELAALGQAQEAYEQQQVLAAEVERLREALDDIDLTCERQGNGHLYNDTAGGWEQAMDDVAAAARAALEEGKDG